jgi:hypothetical protein
MILYSYGGAFILPYDLIGDVNGVDISNSEGRGK